MNDPNGLTQTPDGRLHLFYQANPNSTAAPWAPHQQPTEWGHATSRDLVHFRPADPFDSAITGSSGGAVVLPPALRESSGFDAIAFVGGLRTWTSSDTNLSSWTFQPNGALSQDPMALVPNTSSAGREGAGDNAAWLGDDGTSVYVLSGGFSKKHGPQALLFRSNTSDLLGWEFVSVWYTGKTEDGTSVELNCPDAFPIGKEGGGTTTWGFVWLAHPTWHSPIINVWMIGDVDPSDSVVFRVNRRGLADQSSSFIAAQSLTWSDGRRVQYAWVGTPVADGATGAQTMAREIKLSKSGDRLLFYPVAEVFSSLHDGAPASFDNVSVPEVEGVVELRNGTVPFGQSFHVRATLRLPRGTMSNVTVGLSVLGGAVNASFVRGFAGGWSLDVPGFTRGSEPHSNVTVDSDGSDDVVLDVFVDRSVVEVFVSDGVGAGSIAVTCSVAPKETDVGLKVFRTGDASIVVGQVEVWNMGAACPWS